MARARAVWGIDVGSSALKALRCHAGSGGEIVADAFDYIEYRSLLTPAGAQQDRLVAAALQEFVSRNELRRTTVAVSLPGHYGLVRLRRLPALESGDFLENCSVLENETGFFAIHRDRVRWALEPFRKAGIVVDVVQLVPHALCNFVVFDQLTDLPPTAEHAPHRSPPFTVVLSMGADQTDLIVTNGSRVWQWGIQIGGNRFTRALADELRLSFARAEQLKCNATAQSDPTVLQTIRRVSGYLLGDMRRSIGCFATIEREATIQRVLAAGRAMELLGLQSFLSQGLGIEVAALESFQRLCGPEVVGNPVFAQNCTSFPVCYGLALQGLGRNVIHLNLLPRRKNFFIRVLQGILPRSHRPGMAACGDTNQGETP